MGTHNRCDDSIGGGPQVDPDIPPGAQESLAHSSEGRRVLVPHEAGGGDGGGGEAGGGGLLAGDQQVHGPSGCSSGSGGVSQGGADRLLPVSDGHQERGQQEQQG